MIPLTDLVTHFSDSSTATVLPFNILISKHSTCNGLELTQCLTRTGSYDNTYV